MRGAGVGAGADLQLQLYRARGGGCGEASPRVHKRRNCGAVAHFSGASENGHNGQELLTQVLRAGRDARQYSLRDELPQQTHG